MNWKRNKAQHSPVRAQLVGGRQQLPPFFSGRGNSGPRPSLAPEKLLGNGNCSNVTIRLGASNRGTILEQIRERKCLLSLLPSLLPSLLSVCVCVCVCVYMSIISHNTLAISPCKATSIPLTFVVPIPTPTPSMASFGVDPGVMVLCFFISFFFLFLELHPLAYGSFQASGQLGAAAAGLHQSHSNSGSEVHL